MGLEDLVYMFAEMGIETGVDLDELMDVSDLLERLVGHPLPRRIDRCASTRAPPGSGG
jgi:hydroxymethylglutaryl-CoA lyase